MAHSERTFLDLQNIDSWLNEQCAQTEKWPTSALYRNCRDRALSWERELLPQFDGVLVPSEDDAARALDLAPGSRVHVFPNTIPNIPLPDRAEEDVVIFSGDMSYPPNIAAVRFFRKEIWPALAQRWPGLIWRMIGRNPQNITEYASGDSRIQVVGPVENAIECLGRAKVAVVPLLSGSGTRLKILEAWAAGVPVVSTTVGAEGLGHKPGEHLLIADEPAAFVSAVSSILSLPDLRQRLSRAGRIFFENTFTWEVAWQRLQQLGI
jgi:glycosyltransferase involved in cell wall biosynthesis